MRNKITILSIAILLLAGCATPRQMTLFTGDGQDKKLLPSPQYIIEAGDVLEIYFTAINSEAIAPYNSAGNYYKVDDDGMIEVPIVGQLSVVGKTEEEVIGILTEKVRKQVQNPIVRLTINNAAVTILGEVTTPTKLSITWPITMMEALGSVGGLTKNAKCSNILVQRREGGVTRQYRVNLLTDEIFSSPCYYLQKGDVVYVAPLHAK